MTSGSCARTRRGAGAHGGERGGHRLGGGPGRGPGMPGDPRSVGAAQGAEEQALRRDRPAQEVRRRRLGPDGRDRRRQRGTRRAGRAVERDRAPVQRFHAGYPESPGSGGSRGRVRGRQPGVAALGRGAGVRVHPEEPLGDRRGAGDPRLRPGRQDHRRALYPLPGPGRAAGAGADRFHAGPSDPGARLRGDPAAVPGEPGHHDRHRPAPQVRSGHVPHRGPRLLPHPHRGGAAHQHPPGRGPRPGRPAPVLLRPHPLLSAGKRAPTARTCAA